MSSFCVYNGRTIPFDRPLLIQFLTGGSNILFWDEELMDDETKMSQQERNNKINMLFDLDPLKQDLYTGNYISKHHTNALKINNSIAKQHFAKVFQSKRVPMNIELFSPIHPLFPEQHVDPSIVFPWKLDQHIIQKVQSIHISKELYKCHAGCRFYIIRNKPKKCPMCKKRHDFPGRKKKNQQWLTRQEMQFIADLMHTMLNPIGHHPTAVYYAYILVHYFLYFVNPLDQDHRDFHRIRKNKIK